MNVLFFDEAASALDEATERDIMRYIRALAITHRRSVLAKADRVVELRQ